MAFESSVILTCFAGRRPYLEVMLRYVRALMERGLVTECHLWNFTRNMDDERWLQEHFSDQSKPIKLMHVDNKRAWTEYYHHYTKERYPDHIIIKCDDDVVYVDLDRFHGFLEHRRMFPDLLLAFPSIINNGVCANYQQTAGFHPAEANDLGTFPYDTFCGRLWADGRLAERLHDHFIDNLVDYTSRAASMPVRTIKVGDRISINLFAILSKDLDIFQRIGNDDEHELSVRMPNETGRANYVDMSCFVSHLRFYKQRDTGMNEGRILERYRKVADGLGLPAAV